MVIQLIMVYALFNDGSDDEDDDEDADFKSPN